METYQTQYPDMPGGAISGPIISEVRDREISATLDAFREAMRKKLKIALEKHGDWTNFHTEDMILKLGEEVMELVNAIHMRKYSADDVVEEASDVALVSMFLADRAGNLSGRVEISDPVITRSAVFEARSKINDLLHKVAENNMERYLVYKYLMEIDEELKKALPKLLEDGNVTDFLDNN